MAQNWISHKHSAQLQSSGAPICMIKKDEGWSNSQIVEMQFLVQQVSFDCHKSPQMQYIFAYLYQNPMLAELMSPLLG